MEAWLIALIALIFIGMFGGTPENPYEDDPYDD